MAPAPTVFRTTLRAGVLAALFVGLATPATADVGRFVQDRINDFADIFRIRGGAPKGGQGYGAKVRVTALAQVGAIHFDGHYTGIDGRAIGTVREQRTEGGVSLLYFSRHRMNKVRGNDFLRTDTTWAQIEDRRVIRNLPYWDDGRRDVTSIGLEIATPVLALDLGLSPGQFVDFLAGFVTIDPYRDDMLHVRRREPHRFVFPETDPEPDLEAPTRELRERLEAERAERERRAMERAGQLDGEYYEDEYYGPGTLPADVGPEELPRVQEERTVEYPEPDAPAAPEPPATRERAIDSEAPLSDEALDEVDRSARSLIYTPGNNHTDQ